MLPAAPLGVALADLFVGEGFDGLEALRNRGGLSKLLLLLRLQLCFRSPSAATAGLAWCLPMARFSSACKALAIVVDKASAPIVVTCSSTNRKTPILC